MKKWILYTIFVPTYVLITFFGLGPVLFADGSMNERIITFLIVIALYIITSWVLRILLVKQVD